MDTARAIYHAVAKDAFLELRRGYALGGLIVFVLCTVFIIYLSLAEIEPETWIALYWIAFPFLSVHAILKSFSNESARINLAGARQRPQCQDPPTASSA